MFDTFNLDSAIGILTFKDKETLEILGQTQNAIHFGNLSGSIAKALAGDVEGHIKYMSFGNGGSSLTPSGTIFYRTPNTSAIRDINSNLYNETYKKDISINDDGNNIQVIVSAGTYADIIVTCTLDFGEPAGQDLVDNAGDFDGVYVFDEIGLKNGEGDGLLLSHVIFHPVQKALSRSIIVEYIVRIQMGQSA